jgi:hypothetical protein
MENHQLPGKRPLVIFHVAMENDGKCMTIPSLNGGFNGKKSSIQRPFSIATFSKSRNSYALQGGT